MGISVDWLTNTFSIPQSDLGHVTGTLYELDTEAVFRQGINAIMASEEGIVFDDPLSHNTEYSVAGTTYARKIEVINGYKVKFTPDDQWSVRLAGSNNNLFDVENAVLVQNQVQVIAQNSAGLIVVVSGSGVTEQDKEDIADLSADRVFDEQRSEHVATGSFGEKMQKGVPSENLADYKAAISGIAEKDDLDGLATQANVDGISDQIVTVQESIDAGITPVEPVYFTQQQADYLAKTNMTQLYVGKRTMGINEHVGKYIKFRASSRKYHINSNGDHWFSVRGNSTVELDPLFDVVSG